MLFQKILLIHKMLHQKTSGLEYFSQWIKVLEPNSWEISHMRYIDQNEWRRVQKKDPKMSRKKKDSHEYIKIDKIQKDNTKQLKQIISLNGPITISKFGIIASHSAWLIAQHSDHDRKFQREYLDMMKSNQRDFFTENIKSLELRLNDMLESK